MKIPYRIIKDYKEVDIEQLRPKGSYGELIKKRTHSIDHLIEKYGKIPEDLLIHRSCPTCGSKNNKKVMYKDNFDIVECIECDLVYTNPAFDDEHYKETYRSGEYQKIMKDLGEESHVYRVERFGEERVGIMAKYIKSNPVNYLDIGCSTGFVVEAAKNEGWDAVGIDLNPSAVKFGQERGLELHNVSLEEFDSEKRFFDTISMFDVLEHLINPSRILKQAVDYLKPGGIIFLYVPNWDSASRYLLDKKAHFIWPTHHLNYYTPQTINNFVSKFNLNVELIYTEGLDMVDYVWYQKEIEHTETNSLEKILDKLQFFINAGGYGKNLRVLARKK